jgi:hypothetical protein
MDKHCNGCEQKDHCQEVYEKLRLLGQKRCFFHNFKKGDFSASKPIFASKMTGVSREHLQKLFII